MVQRLSSSLVNHKGQTLDAVLGEGIPVRKKREVFWSGINLVIPQTEVNLINLLKAITPTSGTLDGFFNTTSNKLNVYNDNASVYLKVNLVGSWTSASSNRGVSLNLLGTNGNTLFQGRYSGSPSPDTITFQVTLSVDKDGNIATNGTAPVVQSYGSDFTATRILLIAEQVTTVASINPV